MSSFLHLFVTSHSADLTRFLVTRRHTHSGGPQSNEYALELAWFMALNVLENRDKVGNGNEIPRALERHSSLYQAEHWFPYNSRWTS